ncbi:hypothetical protein GN958_ATG21897 [Phytophthora infestans]|uniref:Uncharacterized protein n=1 Tax=Phytophthora infestans TaxID=4787 RepID=A0A8S9TQA0_PHYIN|nr:hypothetical protein GN958_ATG21897 [Phytophthora infestans]
MEVELANLMGDGPWVEKFIDKAEEHERFGDDTLFRRTTGFKGELAFNVTIDNDNPPNVLIIGVESFRYRDSRYLVDLGTIYSNLKSNTFAFEILGISTVQ